MNIRHNRRVLWAFGLECLLLVVALSLPDRLPAWALKTLAILAVALPIGCYFTIASEPAVYRSWLHLAGEVQRGVVRGALLMWRAFSIQNAIRVARSIARMKVAPTTIDDWIALVVFPFKVYVLSAIPFLWVCRRLINSYLPTLKRIDWSDALTPIWMGYVICLLALLIGALMQSLFRMRERSSNTASVFLVGFVIFLAMSLGWVPR